MTSYVLTLRCPDQAGIVNAVSGALLEVGGNITESAQFREPETNTFALRTVFDSHEMTAKIETTLKRVADGLRGNLTFRPSAQRKRVLVMVSRHEHCLLDILFRQHSGELDLDIPLVISNHSDNAGLAARYEIPYECVPVKAGAKDESEEILLSRVEELDIDFVVLARYMQVLSPRVCHLLAGKVINIHHSFLPGFKGARPYHQAYNRGVKLIGATAHFVTTDLDEGPIIEQDVTRVTHAHSIQELIQMGRDVERVVLSRALSYHSEDRVVLIGGKTVVFS